MQTSFLRGASAFAITLVALAMSPPAAASAPVPADDCGLEPPDRAALAPPVPRKPNASVVDDLAPAFVRPSSTALETPVSGALSGKTVYLSAGHGFTWTDYGWRTQRGNTNGIVEDLVSIEAVNQYLIPYLHAMGAYVVTVREPDLRADAVIVDDGAAILEGTPTERAAETGWGEVALPITSDATAPFAAGSARALTGAASETGGLVYAPALPSSGYYNVYVSFVQGPDRAPDAHWVVRHGGGETHMRIDQRRHGSTWVLLGEFWFEAGADASAAAVAVLDDTAEPGTVISADAVRFGGGSSVHDRGGGTSGRSMAEHAARYYTQWNGAPSSVFAWTDGDGSADVSTRSRFAAWEHEDGEDAVYLAWHSNAPSPRVGTSSYTYGDSAPPGALANFSGTPGSRELQDAVHLEIIDDLRAGWDPAWTDEGRFTAYFGEVNPSHNNEMPQVLVEVAYHDTAVDADSLRDPSFRRIVSRAMAQGIARYFAAAAGTSVVLPPEPPQAIAVTNDGAGGLHVQWSTPIAEPGAGDAAVDWVVQVSSNGYGFDDGTVVQGTSHTIAGLGAGDIRFVRVLGRNAGGRSLPSQTVGAAVAPSGTASVAVIGGFDRLDGNLLLPDDLSAFDLDVVQRMWLRRMNDGSYAVRHGFAIADAGFSFDGATDDAIELGMLALPEYAAVDWFAGEESLGDVVLAPLVRDALADYLDGGGRLLVSGSELGWALDFNGGPDEQAFFRDRLHANYLADDAETYDVTASAGPFAGLAALSFADAAVYDPRFPDVLMPGKGAAIVLEYASVKDGAAAIAWGDGSDGERGILLGFPFETIAGADVRRDVMAAALAFFEVEEAPGPGGDTDGEDTSGTADGGETTAGGTDDPSTASAGTDGSESSGAGQSTDDGGCGCRTTADAHGFLWLLVAGAGARRRRRVGVTPVATASAAVARSEAIRCDARSTPARSHTRRARRG